MDELSTVFASNFVMKPIYEIRGRVPTSFFFEKLNKTRSSLRSSF